MSANRYLNGEIICQDTGESFKIDSALLFGRGENCGVKIDDRNVSRQHSFIFRRDDEYWVIDLASSNGTFLNGNQIKDTEKLWSGDTVEVGERLFRFKKYSSLFEDLDIPIATLARENEQSLREKIKNHNIFCRGALAESLAGVLRKTPQFIDKIAPSFQKRVIIDVGTRKSSFNRDDSSFEILRAIYKEICNSFDLEPGESFHPQEISQILRDEPPSVFCFIGIENLTAEEFHSLRGLGFTESHHRSVFCGENRYIGSKSIANLVEESQDHYEVGDLMGGSTVALIRSVEVILLCFGIHGWKEQENTPGANSSPKLYGMLVREYINLIARYNGTIERFDSGHMLAYWINDSKSLGVPAFNAAKSLVSDIKQLLDQSNISLETRLRLKPGVALHCGKVAYGGMAQGEFTLVGAPVNVSYRLQALTENLCKDAIASEGFTKLYFTDRSNLPKGLGLHKIKGSAMPVEVWDISEF